MTFDAAAANRRAVVAPAAMAQADQRTIDAGVSHATLVQRAARACFRILRSRTTRRPAAVLAGPGSNGEDGLVLAQLLIEAGWPVEVFRPLSDEPLPERLSHLEPHLRPTGVFAPNEGMLVVDALFGAGLSRPLTGEPAALIHRVIGSGAEVFAIDLPSGLDGTTGEVLGAAAHAQTTVTFHRIKPGHLLGKGPGLCGDIFLADIGIHGKDEDRSAVWNAPELWRQHLERSERDTHKYQRGHTVVVGGPGLQGGAARLAARTAAISGAGAVTYFAPLSAAEFAGTRFDAVMVRLLDKAETVANLLNGKGSAAVIGPGMGHQRLAADVVSTVLTGGKPSVVDADALTLYEDRPEALFQMLHEGCVLTPHEGEFARLFPDLEGDKLSRAKRAADRAGAPVLLKGASTVIAAPGGEAVISTNGSPSLATAGSGDCLAGLIGGLLAQGVPAFDAAAMAAFIHGSAGASADPTLNADRLPALIAERLKNLACELRVS